MFLDGLEDAYDKGRLMGTFAEDCAEAFQFTREAQDAYASPRCQGALAAQANGAFDDEIAPVTFETRKGATRSPRMNSPPRRGPTRSRI
jgi:acetyl-CoA C-acetyltransferase